MDTDIIAPVVTAIALLTAGLALLVYNVRRKIGRIKSQMHHAELRRRALRERA